jgi:hypothetical protein
MSSKQNDHTAINLENYESYFMLYVDQELSKEEMEMVDAFLIIHPNLQQDFDLLMSTKLPVESFSFNKEELMAEHMQINAVEEDLLLYIDNELGADRKKIIELELASNKDYWMQYQLLAKAKLDATETIVYPNKEELYHRKGRVIAIQVWMRVAVAIVVIAFLGILYFTRTKDVKPGESIANIQLKENHGKNLKTADPVQHVQQENQNVETVNDHLAASSQTNQIAKQDPVNRLNKRIQKNNTDAVNQQPKINNEPSVVNPNDDVMAYDDRPANRTTTTATIDVNLIDAQTASINGDRHSEGLNNSPVTSFLTNRNTIIDPEPDNHKGSFKGFLRKASRMIEKRTGFDPVNDNGELLIGVVAVKLK